MCEATYTLAKCVPQIRDHPHVWLVMGVIPIEHVHGYTGMGGRCDNTDEKKINTHGSTPPRPAVSATNNAVCALAKASDDRMLGEVETTTTAKAIQIFRSEAWLHQWLWYAMVELVAGIRK